MQTLDTHPRLLVFHCGSGTPTTASKDMANTYHQIYIQAVFAVKYREAVIEKAWRAELLAVIGNLINETGCKTLIVNGVEDHVHCLFGLKPSISVSEVMKQAKAKSSKWLNESGLLPHRFEWQAGFGAFSYSRSQVNRVYRYIQRQEEHHQVRTFRAEYLELLERFEVEYDEQYLFQELISLARD
jgi:REP element-mobilizing transposase RayT